MNAETIAELRKRIATVVPNAADAFGHHRKHRSGNVHREMAALRRLADELESRSIGSWPRCGSRQTTMGEGCHEPRRQSRRLQKRHPSGTLSKRVAAPAPLSKPTDDGVRRREKNRSAGRRVYVFVLFGFSNRR
jgi:hypothetical protein